MSHIAVMPRRDASLQRDVRNIDQFFVIETVFCTRGLAKTHVERAELAGKGFSQINAAGLGGKQRMQRFQREGHVNLRRYARMNFNRRLFFFPSEFFKMRSIRNAQSDANRTRTHFQSRTAMSRITIPAADQTPAAGRLRAAPGARFKAFRRNGKQTAFFRRRGRRLKTERAP